MYAVLFDGDTRWLWIGVTLFCLTMVIGVLGAVGEKPPAHPGIPHDQPDRLHLAGRRAVYPGRFTAGIFYLLHHMIVKASLCVPVHRRGRGSLRHR